MKIGLHNNKDFLAGLLLIGVGAGAFYMALDYPFGSTRSMGPGYFPRILAGIAIAFGELGKALTGGSQNAALNIIQKAIDDAVYAAIFGEKTQSVVRETRFFAKLAGCAYLFRYSWAAIRDLAFIV